MQIIRPVTVSDSVLSSSDIPENDYDEYNPATAYIAGDTVIVTDAGIHNIYEALTSTTGQYPPDNSTGDTPVWLNLGKTNRWRMFDGKTSTFTTSADTDIVVTLSPSQVVNSLALFGLTASTVNITVNDPVDGEVYNKTINLISSSGINDWYAYFFEQIEFSPDVVFADIPSYSTATITVTITGTNPACGLLIFGQRYVIGKTIWGTSVGITDYSRKEIDAFGNYNIVERRFSKRAEYDVTIDTPKVGNVQRVLAEYRSTPLVWIGDSDFSETIVYGYYRDFDMILSNVSVSDCSLAVEGL